jgi:hypothetical protein
MDEATRTSRPALDDGQAPARSPEEIRADIERTRRELGDTVEAVVEKADLKAQAKARAEEVKDRAKRNPLPLAAGIAVVTGFVLWRVVRGGEG